MERQQNEMVSLTNALRDGASPEDIRKSFEAALQEAQNEVAAEQAEASKFCGGEDECGDCATCPHCAQCELDEARSDMVYAVIDYLYALGIIPEDVEFDEEDIDQLLESIEEIEEEVKAKINFMKMLGAIAKAGAEKSRADKTEDKKVDAADAIIQQFLKGLR